MIVPRLWFIVPALNATAHTTLALFATFTLCTSVSLSFVLCIGFEVGGVLCGRRVYSMVDWDSFSNVVGELPEELWSLTYLTNLYDLKALFVS